MIERRLNSTAHMILAPRNFGMASADFPRWDNNYAEICARIERVRAPLKIVLKTKNEPLFIERWIKHHQTIVGPENLIVFDNMSDHPEVLSIYRKYRGQVEIVRFADRWDNVHHTYLYGNLYRALAKSSDYFIFLDTDEYLVLIENDRYYGDDRISTFVMDNKNHDVFPSTWLWNANWSATQFSCSLSPGDFANNLACGKPLIRSTKIPTGYVNHNFQLSTRLFKPPFRTSLFLLHLARLYPQQRITANLNKLIAARVVHEQETPESIARRSDITDDVMAGYVDEIRDCLAAEARTDVGDVAIGPGCLELLQDGVISYYGEVERKVINDFITDPKPIYNLIADRYRLNAVLGENLGRSDAYGLGRLYV